MASDDTENGLPTRNDSEQLVIPTELLKGFSEDVEYLWCPRTTPILERPPSALIFLRDYVSKSVPCIIRNAITTSQPKSLPLESNENLSLTLDDLVDICAQQNEDVMLTVDATPDGHGDCVRTVTTSDGVNMRMFVKPEERTMTLSEFRAKLRRQDDKTADHPDSSQVETDEDGKVMFPLAPNQIEHPKINCEAISSYHDNALLYYSRQVSWVMLF